MNISKDKLNGFASKYARRDLVAGAGGSSAGSVSGEDVSGGSGGVGGEEGRGDGWCS